MVGSGDRIEKSYDGSMTVKVGSVNNDKVTKQPRESYVSDVKDDSINKVECYDIQSQISKLYWQKSLMLEVCVRENRIGRVRGLYTEK